MYRPAVLISLLALVFTACQPGMPEDVEAEYAQINKVDFNLDVKPLLSDRCYHCHGPDAEQRKAGLRLDTQDGLFATGKNGAHAFVGGKLGKSEAIRRILSDDPDLQMPPPESNRALSARDKAMLIKWVENGAQWKEHWSFIPPVKPTVPKASGEIVNEIDAFIIARLDGLEQSPQAEKEQLLRRVTIDLTGLPPTIEEQDDFLSDQSEDAYEKVVDRLLSSDEYAERMTLDWLDLARYADSHGFHADGVREMWPWRDWVIEAFKENMPYDQFVTEQLAGDLIPDASREQVIATAFNRNHPMTAEGGVVDEEFRLEYVANRTNTLGTAFLGLTLECAKCHDHKFDPISQKEYYQLSAFFNNIRELGMTGDDGDYGPMLPLSSEDSEKMIAYIDEQIASQNVPRSGSDIRKPASPLLSVKFNRIVETDSVNFMDSNPNAMVNRRVTLVEGINGKAARFDHQDANVYLNDFGRFEAIDPFTVSLWVKVEEETTKTKILIGNAGGKNTLWRGWDFYLDSASHLSFRLINSLPHNMIHIKTRERVPVKEWTQVFVTYDGSMSAEGIRLGINGSEEKTTVVYDRLYKNILPTNTARTLDKRGAMMGKSYRSFTGDNGILKGAIDELAVFDFEVPQDQFKTLYDKSKNGSVPVVQNYASPSYLAYQKSVYKLRKEKLALQDSIPELMVMEEMSSPRATHILKRGEYDKPQEQVYPGTIESIMAFDSTMQPNRLGLSNWLFDKRNPLTARVAVNRYWQLVFGRGIVSTVNDFGSQGALPTHPELLDFLAVEFVESGWDIRALLKKMVMSATYRQTSQVTRENFNKDPENILLARGPSYRQPAEFIRDNALASSGLLNPQIGGQSAKPYQPDSLWVELGNFSHFLLYYHQDHDENQYRRSMYTFIRRTSPPPNMILFDAPNREVCTVTRERTNTPLQALVLLNDPQFVEASRALAHRISSEQTLDDQINKGFRLVLSRTPSREEKNVLIDLYEQELAMFREDPSRAEDFLAVGDFNPGYADKEELAALTVVANTLFNMDEAYMKR